MNNLKITNYDNFKDLSFFVEEHEKAKKMIEDIDKFYVSFLKSKLISGINLDKWNGSLFTEQKSDLVGIPYNTWKRASIWAKSPSLLSLSQKISKILEDNPKEESFKDLAGTEVEFVISDFEYIKSFYRGPVKGKIMNAYKMQELTNFYMFQVKLDHPIVRHYYWNLHSCSHNKTLDGFVASIFSSSMDAMFDPDYVNEGKMYKYYDNYGHDTEINRSQVYKSPVLQKKLKSIIVEKFNNRRSDWLKNIVFFEDENKRLQIFDSVSDFSKFKFSIKETDDKRFVFVSREKFLDEGIAFDIENGNLIGYITLDKK